MWTDRVAVPAPSFDAMIDEYDVSRELWEHDVLVLARDLVDKKLISVA